MGLRGAPEVPPLCRETQSLGQQMLNAPFGIVRFRWNVVCRASNRRPLQRKASCRRRATWEVASFIFFLTLFPFMHFSFQYFYYFSRHTRKYCKNLHWSFYGSLKIAKVGSRMYFFFLLAFQFPDFQTLSNSELIQSYLIWNFRKDPHLSFWGGGSQNYLYLLYDLSKICDMASYFHCKVIWYLDIIIFIFAELDEKWSKKRGPRRGGVEGRAPRQGNIWTRTILLFFIIIF